MRRPQRNTRSSERNRNTKLQLQLVPRSKNEQAKQSKHLQAVVSVRLSGAVIGTLDKLVEKQKAEGRYSASRSRILKEAISLYLKERTNG